MLLTPLNGLATLARREVSKALKTVLPAGKSIWFTPRFGFLPANAAVGHGLPPHRFVPESSPFPAKLAMVAPAAMAQLMAAGVVAAPQPKPALVAEMAFNALVL